MYKCNCINATVNANVNVNVALCRGRKAVRPLWGPVNVRLISPSIHSATAKGENQMEHSNCQYLAIGFVCQTFLPSF